MNHCLTNTIIEILVRKCKTYNHFANFCQCILLRCMCFIIQIHVSEFSKCNVKEEKYIDNYIQVNFIFIENKDHLYLERSLQTMAQNINITKISPLIVKAGNTKIVSIRPWLLWFSGLSTGL